MSTQAINRCPVHVYIAVYWKPALQWRQALSLDAHYTYMIYGPALCTDCRPTTGCCLIRPTRSMSHQTVTRTHPPTMTFYTDEVFHKDKLLRFS